MDALAGILPTSRPVDHNTLREAIQDIGSDAGAMSVAVSAYDFEHHTAWSLQGDRWFHAASTIKVPVLLAVYDAIEQKRFERFSRVHVRNRFIGMADDKPFRVDSARDANSAVHNARGNMMTVEQLAEHMIVTSSNLATNLLLDLVGIDAAQDTLRRLHLTGIDLRRGVEDEAAWAAGINNRVTADGLRSALRLIEEREAISTAASDAMLDILHGQKFRSGIPAGLPDDVRVAHKTGEMSTAAHDAGIVYLEDRAPYVVVILTEWEPGVGGRQKAIAAVSRAVYSFMTGGTA